MGWLAWISVILTWVNDWVWVWVTYILVWGTGYGRWPSSPWWFVGGLALLIIAELAMRQFLPGPAPTRTPGRLIIETMTLLWLSLLFGTVPGIVAWQGAVGFDASVRLSGFVHDSRRRLAIRGIRFLVALSIVVWLPLGFR
ncbi:MAG: hypothetical protein M1499_02305 [Firmicutes bacterium]|nr:hypothetical protein [Bacillota bacterium]